MSRHFCHLLIASLLLAGCQPAANNGGNSPNSNAASSQKRSDYPRRSVQIICPWGVGGGTDRISRYFADALRKELGIPFVVVNKTGGSGVHWFSGTSWTPSLRPRKQAVARRSGRKRPP